MTIQEAIERLHNLQSINEDDLSAYIGVWYKGIKDDYAEALDMAIEALQQGCEKVAEGCDDLIRRQAAIDAYGDWYVEEGPAEGFIGTVKQLLEGLPSAQPDNRLAKIADLVEGTIDHFDLDDAMDLLYQIKEVLK